MLVGCKADIEKKAGKGNLRQVTLMDAQEMAKSAGWAALGCVWGECSSKTGQNVESIFRSVAEKVLIHKSSRSPDVTEADTIRLEGDRGDVYAQNNGCC